MSDERGVIIKCLKNSDNTLRSLQHANVYSVPFFFTPERAPSFKLALSDRCD